MRFPPISEEKMSRAQQEIAASCRTGWRAAIASGDGRLGGPLDATLRSPELAARLNRVSDYFREGTSLPARLNEWAILVVAREWNSSFEWQAHYALAMEAGLARVTAEQLARGETPLDMEEDEAVVYHVATALQRQHRLDDSTFQKAKDTLGEQQLVDLVAVCGYYTLVAMMLATADVHTSEPPDAGAVILI